MKYTNKDKLKIKLMILKLNFYKKKINNSDFKSINYIAKIIN